MAKELTALVSVSIAGLLLASGLWARRTGEWRSFLVGTGALIMFAAFLNRVFGFPFPPAVVTKGSGGDLMLASALYLCMVLGMFAQYGYHRLERPAQRRVKWDWGPIIAPVLASPIVFIPLLAAFQGAGIDLKQLTAPRLMIFFVAFQNGFFWRDFFDRKMKQKVGRK
jgi:hypothetical protein